MIRYRAGETLKDVAGDACRVVDGALCAAPPAERAALERQRDEGFGAALAVFRANEPALHAAWALLADTGSRIEYVREAVFKLFQTSFGALFAVAHTDGMPFAHIDSFTRLVDEQLADGTLPRLRHTREASLYQFLKTTFLFEQYRHDPAGVAVAAGDVFLDIGACFGDVSLWAARAGASRVYAFEPDPENFPLLAANLVSFAPPGIVQPVPLAFGHEAGRRRFRSDIGSSRFADDGDALVAVSTIDHWCGENRVQPDFIKMDIEGAEASALAGARTTIVNRRPKLAISLYHKFSDLWELPLLLHEYVPDCRFHCRKHHPIHECMLYANPRR